jgi:hypothetical protein
MTLFNHEIEYLPVYSYSGIQQDNYGLDIRIGIVSYDNLLGERCRYVFGAPSGLWTSLTVGGTASAGGTVLFGIVSEVGDFLHKILTDSGELTCYVLPHRTPVSLGANAVVFDHLLHSSVQRDQDFTKGMVINPSSGLIDQLGIHSINVMVWKDATQLGTIRIDPFTQVACYENLQLEMSSGVYWTMTDEWQNTHE